MEWLCSRQSGWFSGRNSGQHQSRDYQQNEQQAKHGMRHDRKAELLSVLESWIRFPPAVEKSACF
jgi:hypothetical protein